MIEKVKENPIKFTISVVTLITMLVGAVLSVDSRYAKASDFEKQQVSIQYSIDQLRKQSIDDKIFELELIPEKDRTQSDKARLEKYKRESKSIDSNWQGRVPK